MARYNKKRVRELQHDKFRDTTISFFDQLGDRLEGQGRTLLYALAGVIALVVLASVYSWWSGRRADEARNALGRAMEIAGAPVSPSPGAGATTPSFTSERERAQKAVEEFQKVADKYTSDPTHALALYLKATNLLTVDHNRGVSELESLGKSGNNEVAAQAKFALAQAREADGQYDAAGGLYSELARTKDSIIPPDTVKLRLAHVDEKLNKHKEASDLLFGIVEAARNARDKDGKPVPLSAAAREAATELEKIDPARSAQLPPEPPPQGLPF